MKNIRHWATPLTIGAFAVMAVTGILMFFHLQSGLNKTAHEWLGWVMVIGVAGHVVANWAGFKRYFLSSTMGRAILVFSVLVMAGSFVSFPGNGRDGLPPPVLAMKAVIKAPLSSVALLSAKPVEQILADLGKAGIQVAGPDASLDQVVAGDRALEARAMNVIFGTR
jgi:hypothetical protein